jgi:hypothetical protein
MVTYDLTYCWVKRFHEHVFIRCKCAWALEALPAGRVNDVLEDNQNEEPLLI